MVGDTRVRVLVSFDSAHPTKEILQLLPRLLGPAQLELTGLYVEDEDLLRAAQLPGSREVTLNGQLSNLDEDRLRREQAEEAATIRRTFETLATSMRLRHRFLITRGRASEELMRIAGESDFVMVTRALRASGLRPRTGVHYGALARQPKNVLFVNEPWRSGTSVVVLNGSAEALAIGRRFAEADGLRLVRAEPSSTPLSRHPTDQPTAGTVEPDRRVTLDEWDEESIADLCLSEDARLLIVPRTQHLDWAALLPGLMDRLPCSVLQLG